MQKPPLSLYIHIPWCVQKCPYCDFNSHGIKSASANSPLPEQEYVMHLLQDLEQDIENYHPETVQTIFIGGGTPSLFSVAAMKQLLEGVKQRIPVIPNAEVTLEANPGTVEAEKFAGFVDAGVNRISVGVQSFNNHHLSKLGRIHDGQQAIKAIEIAKSVGLNTFNLDIMHGLPGQSVENALADLRQAIALNPPHLSWYQLTIEPNTLFHSKPPTLPEDEILWDIQEQGHQLLEEAGYQQYEISAYSKPEQQCQHNLNYWRFGDYLGIGCGAHGKITQSNGDIFRTSKVKHPKGYMDLTRHKLFEQHQIEKQELGFEYFMNRFRLMEPCPKHQYLHRTGLDIEEYGVNDQIQLAMSKGLLCEKQDSWQLTDTGKRYLNEVLTLFL